MFDVTFLRCKKRLIVAERILGGRIVDLALHFATAFDGGLIENYNFLLKLRSFLRLDDVIAKKSH